MFQFIPPEIWSALATAIGYIYKSAAIWLPIGFGYSFFNAWLGYKQAAYWQKLGSVLLEIKIPRDIFKSPVAMEVVLGTLHQTADEGNWYWKYWKGQTRSWFSLEIISQGGNIRFFIWSRKKYKNNIETHLYSQYPGIEVHEVPDYTTDVYFDPKKMELFGCQWELSEPDPYPIKTYVDYGLDRDPKEELKVDPMTSMLEFLGSITAGHNIWTQIIIRAHKKEQKKPLPWAQKLEKFAWSETVDAWKDEAKSEMKKIIEKFRPEDKEKQSRQATEGEKDTIAALERSISKLPYDCGIRTVYFAPKDIYNSMYLGGMLGIFKQYGYPGLNSFKSAGWHGTFNYPWKKWFNAAEKMSPKILDEYKFRSFFFSSYMGKPFYSKPFVLNSEELATIFHLPGAVANTPTLERIPSKKSEAPANLPL